MISNRFTPLEGIRVVEIGHFVAAPNLGALLAHFGAEVIKIEPPGGDESKRVAPWAYYIFSQNKKNIAIDLTKPEGLEIFKNLIKTCDVLIENLSPKAVEKLGIGYDSLSALNQRLIYCSIKGFASDSRDWKRPAFDTVAQAESGLLATLGREGEEPIRINNPCIDMGAAAYALAAIAMAVMQRVKTGRGAYIEIPLLDVAVYWNGYWIAYYSLTGREPARLGAGHAGYSPYGVYKARDGYVFIGVITDEQWLKLCESLGIAPPENLRKMQSRIENRIEVDKLVSESVAKLSVEEVLNRLRDLVPASPLKSVKDVAEDAALEKRGVIVSAKIDDKIVKVAQPPIRINKNKPRTDSAIGSENNIHKLLEELGYSVDEIAQLYRKGVIA